MKTIKECWNIPLIVVNVSIASLGMIQIGLAVSLRHTLDSSSDVLKYERKLETVLLTCAGLLSFIVGFYGICITCMYVPFFLITYVIMLILAMCVQLPVCLITIYSLKEDLISEHMFQDSNRMIKDDKPPQGLIYLQRNLYCCGFEGFSDYKKPPSSCCKNQVTCEFSAGDIYQTGCKRAMGVYLEPFVILIGAILIHHVVFDIIGLIGGIYQVYYIKKEMDPTKFLYPEPTTSYSFVSAKETKPERLSAEAKTRSYLKFQSLTRNELMRDREGSRLASSLSLLAGVGVRSQKDFGGKHDRNPSEEWFDEEEEEEKPRSKGNSAQIRKSHDRRKSEVIEPDSVDAVEENLKEIDPADILKTSTIFGDEKDRRSSLRKARRSSDKKDRKRNSSVVGGKVCDEIIDDLNIERTTKQSIDAKGALLPRLSRMDSINQKKSVVFSQSGEVVPPIPHDASSQTAPRKSRQSSTIAVSPTESTKPASQKSRPSSDANKLPTATRSGTGSTAKPSGSPLDKASEYKSFTGSANLDKSVVGSHFNQVQPSARSSAVVTPRKSNLEQKHNSRMETPSTNKQLPRTSTAQNPPKGQDSSHRQNQEESSSFNSRNSVKSREAVSRKQSASTDKVSSNTNKESFQNSKQSVDISQRLPSIKKNKIPNNSLNKSPSKKDVNSSRSAKGSTQQSRENSSKTISSDWHTASAVASSKSEQEDLRSSEKESKLNRGWKSIFRTWNVPGQ